MHTLVCTAVQRLTFSAPQDVANALKQFAHEQHVSVSAWVAQAAAIQARSQRLNRAIDDWEAEHGALSEDQLAAADRALDAATRSR